VNFEGETVTGGSQVTIRQHKGDIEIPLTVDELVELRVVAKVSEVNHVVNQKTGLLTRVHVLQVQEVEVA
jgi:hypothetical protein